MAKTVVALYDQFDEARGAVEALVDAGFDRGDISLIVNDATGAHGRYVNNEVTDVYDEDVSAGEGAGFGAVVGALVGLGVALIPGIGTVVAAGPLAAALMAGIGAASGAVTGGLVAGLMDFGIPEEHAQYYAEGIRRGGTLVSVHVTHDEWADRAQSILNRFDPTDINERSGEWLASGWTGFDETAAPASANAAQSQAAGSTTPEATATAPATTHKPYAYYESRFRANYNTNYVDSGYDYGTYEPAYHYGYMLANDLRYRDYDWARLEPEAQHYWNANHPGTWDRVKGAVHDAWHEATGR